uniref:alanine--tRNA ligase n=1 Tax=Kryptolebias marmoratus TaxID=37003 RepID=A0A3Q3AGK9_KRYMA
MLRLPFRRLRPLSAASGRSFSGLPPPLPAAQVRSTFLDFFRDKHGHLLVPSSPVRPRGDPSLLFVNAGMNQFKPIFLGTADPRSEMASYHRVVNSQKCVRAGGKHNDLEDVGRDGYHHTFFEMLGNWSFGDYFKVGGALYCTWSRPTGEGGASVCNCVMSGGGVSDGVDPPHRALWDTFLPFGLKDNFWEMGDTGPCGPCTEIHYDHVGGRDARTLVNMDSPDVVEIWNLVFIQYNRSVQTPLRLLPRFSVDTGMGLERLTGVLQGRRSNYDTDLFTPLLHAIQQRSGAGPYAGRTGTADEGQVDLAYRVVADHIRTLSVCIADGVHPGMSGAELVLRRILRRAVRFCIEVLKAPQGALASLVPTVTYMLVKYISHNASELGESGRRFCFWFWFWSEWSGTNCPVCVSASVAWSLHRDLGFPLDLVDLMLAERGVQVDRQELDRLIVVSEQQAGVSSRLMLDVLSLAALQRVGVPHTDDSLKYAYRLEDGRYVFPACHATVLALFDGQALVPEVREGQSCGVILDRTCFYSEQGGQSHDRGYFTCKAVHRAGGYVVHQVTAVDSLKTGDQIQLHLDQAHRMSCMVKHTATHILNFALRKVLGSAVSQRGSHVSADRLRFDCSIKVLTRECVNDIISANQIVHSQEVPLQTARTIRGLRTVDEVYPDPVRVVSLQVPVSELLETGTDRETSDHLFTCNVNDITGGGVTDLSELLICCVLPLQDSPALAASDWAVALCQHLGGSAGGSALVAQGTGSSSDITEALRWAEDFACQKTQR